MPVSIRNEIVCAKVVTLAGFEDRIAHTELLPGNTGFDNTTDLSCQPFQIVHGVGG